jgi:hypothetical protein
LEGHYKKVKEADEKYDFQKDCVEDFVQSEWEKGDEGLTKEEVKKKDDDWEKHVFDEMERNKETYNEQVKEINEKKYDTDWENAEERDAHLKKVPKFDA